MKEIKDKTFDEERALYALSDAVVENCRFEGPADGESALKESHDITVRASDFALRYPFWHMTDSAILNCTLRDTCRAALWYAGQIRIADSELLGIKAVRECENVGITGCRAVSPEFGWFCRNLTIENSEITGEYFLLHSENILLRGVTLHGKYSFQYCKNVTIYDSVLDTKDAFWETENVTVYNSVVKGEYLAWYAKNLRLVNCRISGTQPLCYAKGLVLENCTMEGCVLSFEYSEVDATVSGHIDSVKNPLCGRIVADSIGEILFDENRRDEGRALVTVRGSGNS